MTAVGWLPADAEELFGPDATAEESYDLLTVDVPPATWTDALRTARDRLGCRYFDWLSAVDEPGTGFRVVAHVVALAPVRRLLLRTTVPHDAPTLPTAVGVYAGAAWHERETHEMFGVDFADHPGLDHLLLPETFEGHPLRKDFVLAARVAKAWPGAKEPGESEHGGPKRRQMLPPGVPDPNEWGPLKGQLPPAPARPARATGRGASGAGAAGRPATGERPVRRSRTASDGSASQTAARQTPSAPPAPPADEPATGSGTGTGTAPGDQAQGAAPPPAGPRRARSASEGSASQRPSAPRRSRSASEGSATQRGPGTASAPEPAPRSPDAPWHHARPAHGDGPEDAPTSDGDRPETPAPATEATPESPEDPPSTQPPAAPEDPEGGRP
ncbi:NADH-quinone oxidoreductase subunit C [Streptomyces sp. NPDC004610]|uniref:NADH-quinone oxidoreductase subunit C n=1 Tax=unclassified Streptomyces TaxID=2593676 RepID=UPI0033A5433A